MIRTPFWNRSRNISKKQPTPKRGRPYRRALFEPLETRQLLSITLPTIDAQTLYAGAPLNLALQGNETSGHEITYTAAISNASLTNATVSNPTLTATIPTGNPSLRLTVDDEANNIHGEIVIQLFEDLAPTAVASMEYLVDNDFYDGLTFHRIIADFMIQGGDPLGDGTGGPSYRFDNEINAALQFTSGGVLAMANSGDDTNGSQFFITVDPARWLDFGYTIFGFVTEGMEIVEQLSNVPTDTADPESSTYNRPLSDVIITDAEIVTDTQRGVLRLSAPNGTTGSADVTITATDTVTGETTSQTFHVTVAADTVNNPPFLGTINPISTNADTPISFYLPATDVEGDSIYYAAVATDSNLTVSVDHATGRVTVTPAAGVAGAFSILVGVAASSTTSSSYWDTQYVPTYVNPAVPSGITLTAASDTGISNADQRTKLNNAPGKPLLFQVDGVIDGALVELFADGTLIGSATADGTSVTITTNETVTLTDGAHVITARQTLEDVEVSAGNLQTTVDLASSPTANYVITVETVAPEFDFTPAIVAVELLAYSCQVTATDNSTAGLTYELYQGPLGMTIDSSTGLLTWTPPDGDATTADVTVRAVDAAGNIAERHFSITILSANAAPVLTPANPAMGVTDEDSPLTVALIDTFLNHGENTTGITDEDVDALIGGIVLTGMTGNGTWQYSLDGTTYETLASVSSSSALLLSSNALLRYIPDGMNGETATLTYRAWDATSGVEGGRADLTGENSLGGYSAFSAEADTASLTVQDVNDAPVLTAANPSLGSTTSTASAVLSLLETFLNHGANTTLIADIDHNADEGGIALVGVQGNGLWEYSLDGAIFYDVGTIGEDSALLLSRNALLRYTPLGTDNETATITYRAWDASAGEEGDRADLSESAAVGESTAFSAALDTAWLTVNDAPVLTAANPSLGATDENTAVSIRLVETFLNNGQGTTTISDPNPTTTTGAIALAGTTGNGSWEYSLDGTTFFPLTSVDSSSALLLPATATLRYTPDGKNGETATITYRAWDATSGTAGSRVDLSEASAVGGATAFSDAADTASLTVNDVNDAPVLTPANPSLGVLASNSPVTISLTDTFLNNGDGTTTIADVDASALVGGLAIVAATGNGTWEYSLDGTTFTAFGSVGESSALLLPHDAQLRFTPTDLTGAVPAITYRAWDASAGSAGSKVDLSGTGATGGSTAFSTTTDAASFALQSGSISGFVYLDTDNDGLRITATGEAHLALPGVIVRLFVKNSAENWVEVAGQSPVLTGADGSYRFDNLAAGVYRVQETQPANYLDGLETAGKIDGVVSGVAGQDQFDIELGAGDEATSYNFGERGLKPTKISLQMFLASAPSAEDFITQMNAAPTVDLSESGSGNNHSATFEVGGSAVAIAAGATIADADSLMLAWMTATISTLYDGDAESLQATTANTPVTANYANGVLRLSGAAELAVYEAILRSIKYGNSASSPNTEERNIDIVVGDGIATSQAVQAKVAMAATLAAAVDSALAQVEDWLSE